MRLELADVRHQPRRDPPPRRTADSTRRDRRARPAGPRADRAGAARRSSPVRSAFSRASSSASAETSIAVTRAPGCSSAIASAIAPVPVPTSRTRGASSPCRRASAALDDDLGLGTRDQRAAVDRQRQPRKPHSPRRYATGSWRARRATSSRYAASSASRQRPVEVGVELDPRRGRARARAGARRPGVPSRSVLPRCSAARRSTSPSVSVAEVTPGSLLEPVPPVLLLQRRGEVVRARPASTFSSVERHLDPVVGRAAVRDSCTCGSSRRARRSRSATCAWRRAPPAGARARPRRCRARSTRIAFDLVLELRLLVLHRDDDPGRQVRDPDGGVGRVDALAARARSSGRRRS